MSIRRIDPSDLYVSFVKVDLAQKICADDTAKSITDFEAFYLHRGYKHHALHGIDCSFNFYRLAVQATNLTLVNYMIGRMDKQCLNARDKNGQTALFDLRDAKGSVEKVVACANMLIRSGIEINARNGEIANQWGAPLQYVLNLSALEGVSVLGFCMEMESWHAKDPQELKKLKTFAGVLIENGADCFIKNLGLVDWRHTLTRSNELIDEKDSGTSRENISRVLKEIEAGCNWPKIRWLYAAQKNRDSLLYGIPTEVTSLIAVSLVEQPFSLSQLNQR